MFNSILLPPGISLLLLTVGFFGVKKFRRTALGMLFIGGFSLLVLSMPWVSASLAQSLESERAISSSQLKQFYAGEQTKRAIVVLSGGRLSRAAEYGNIDTVNEATLHRLKYASWLQKKTALPILLSGGSQFNEATPEAVLMNQTLLTSFKTTPRWIESQSINIAEKALFSNTILKQNNITEILLVTHAWHMPRAKRAFQKQGLLVIPAPMAFTYQGSQTTHFSYFLPNAQALENSNFALRELLINLWLDIFSRN